jgi:Na+/citrate or Na+/malate symporter
MMNTTTTTYTPARVDDTPVALPLAGPFRKLARTRIGIVPLPVYLLLLALIAGFVLTGKVPNDICVSIAILTVGGFSCAEVGKRLPFFRNIGAAAIFATFIPSYLAFSKLLPAPVLKNVVDFTKSTNSSRPSSSAAS